MRCDRLRRGGAFHRADPAAARLQRNHLRQGDAADTTSNVAGGLWDPVTVFDHARVTPEFHRQFGVAGRFAFRRYQSMVGETYGVRWLPYYSLSRDSAVTPAPPESPYSQIAPLYPEAKQLTRDENPFDVPYAYRRYSMLIEPAIYLNALMRDFYVAGGRIVVREFAEARDFMSLRESLLFNCTGLGARPLFHDDELIPIRGQLSFLLPQPEVEYMTSGPGDIYMFPRRDGSCWAARMSGASRAWKPTRRRNSASCGRTPRCLRECASGAEAGRLARRQLGTGTGLSGDLSLRHWIPTRTRETRQSNIGLTAIAANLALRAGMTISEIERMALTQAQVAK